MAYFLNKTILKKIYNVLLAKIMVNLWKLWLIFLNKLILKKLERFY